MYDQILAKKVAGGADVTLDYHTRGTQKISLSKEILADVSKALGHKRIGVSVIHYLKHHFA